MNLYVFHDGRYFVDEVERIWTLCNADNRFWSRYLNVYESVVIVARAKKIKSSELNASFRLVSESQNIGLYALPYFVGPLEYLKKLFVLRNSINALLAKLKESDSVILRTPLSFFIPKELYKFKYGVEVVGDAFDSLYKKTFISFIYANIYARSQNKIVTNATVVSYVTQHALQKRFPPPANVFTTNYSSINMHDSDYQWVESSELEARYEKNIGTKSWHIIAVGSLEFEYKGAEVLMQAIRDLVAQGYNIQVTWLGGGKLIEKYKFIADSLSISSRFKFLGAVSPKEVRHYLGEVDLFVLPSKTEGLPRAMIEAMASCLVCIGTDVGGVSELITKEFLAKPNSVASLVETIKNVINMSPTVLATTAQQNHKRANMYHHIFLEKKRNDFYKELLR